MKDRHIKILDTLNARDQVSVQELAAALGTSMVTIRKDLEELEGQGLLKRMHGYATKTPSDAINAHMAYNYADKCKIARLAVDMVTPQETIMIESGSTCALFALEAAAKKEATIITNSVYIAHYVNQIPNARVILLGGDYDQVSEVTTGPVTQLCAGEYHVDKIFVGIDGYTDESGFTNVNHTRCATVKGLAERADKVIVLTASDKFGKQSVAKMFAPEQVHTVVTDCNISEEHLKSLNAHGIQVITTGEA